MAIKKQNISDNLKYNYGEILKALLIKFNVQRKFLDTYGVGNTSWNSTCDGKSYFRKSDELYENTRIDKNILMGGERIKINNYSDEKEEEKDKENQSELEIFLNIYDKNPNELKSKENKDKYNVNFMKMFEYVISLTAKDNKNENADEKIKEIIKRLDNIEAQTYMKTDIKLLECFKNDLEEHIKVISAIMMIEDFKNKKTI